VVSNFIANLDLIKARFGTS